MIAATPMAEFLVVVTRPETSESAVHTCDGAVVVGRGSEAGIRLPHPFVSRLHARIALLEGGLHITDLGSVNGTHVDGVLVRDQAAPATVDSIVTIGPFLLSFRDDSAATVQDPARAPTRWKARLDRRARRLLIEGRAVVDPLTAHEYALLEALDKDLAGTVARETLGDAVWGSGQWDVYMLYNLVSRLRRRIAEAGVEDEVLLTVPGFGYRLT